VTADSGSGEPSEEFAVKRPFCAKTGEGREKASWVEERTLRLPCAEDFEEEKRVSNQPMIRRIAGGGQGTLRQVGLGRLKRHAKRN
jgi:hypothetical protein